MPSSSGTADTIKISIDRNTLLSVSTREGYFGQISYRVQTGTTMKLIIPPTMSSSYSDQRGELFMINHNGDIGIYNHV
jgi:hypothetical protein